MCISCRCAQRGLSINETWNLESVLFRGGTVIPWGIAAQHLWARASDWKDKASAINFFKSNKRKFTVVTWFRSSSGKAQLCVPESASRSTWHSADGLCSKDKPRERKGGVSQRYFKIRYSEQQICPGRRRFGLYHIQACYWFNPSLSGPRLWPSLPG